MEEECLEAVRQEVGMEVVGKGGDVVLGGSADAVKGKLREAMSRTAAVATRQPAIPARRTSHNGRRSYGHGVAAS